MSFDTQLIIAAAFGAVAVIIASVLDFHAPYRISEIRNAVLRQRYWFALAVYSTIALIAYLLVLDCAYLIISTVLPDYNAELRLPAKEYEKLKTALSVALAVPPAIAFMGLVPHLPLLRDITDAIRRAMQSLARYPQTVEILTAIISRSPFKVSDRAVAEVTGELERYGVSPQLIDDALANNNKVLADSAAKMIQQICSFHLSFQDLRDDPRFERFFAIRKEVFDDLDKHYRRVLRRSARALLIADEMSPSSLPPEELALEVSGFVAQECEDLREKYQRLLAEATISGLSSRAARTGLISSFGYTIDLPRTLPLWPLVVIFAADFVASVAPIYLMPNMPEQFRVSTKTAELAALAHGFGLTLSVFLAVYPKAVTNFARPSLFALPRRSYVLFGLVSYLVGNAVLYATYSTIDLAPGWPAASHPFATSTLFSVVFLVNTVILSILLDVRLRSASLAYYNGRLLDGITLAVVMMSLMVIFVVGFLALLAWFQMPSPPVEWYLYAFSIFCFGVLGFVMGYLVPSTAQVYLEANKFTLQWTEKPGMSIGWATQRSHPEAPVVS
jgi:xanthosine utilization system XapX-like protein